MGANTAPERFVAAVGETNLFAVSFAGLLDSGESLTGTPAVVEVTTSDLTIANIAAASNKGTVNTSTIIINGVDVVAGDAVQFKVSGQLLTHTPYTIMITAGTDSTPAQTKVKYVRFMCEGA